MSLIISRRAAGPAAAALITILALAACSSSSSGSGGAAVSSGKAAAHSALAQPTVSADVAQLESKLLVAYQQNFNPMHPYASMKVAIHKVFPSGDASAIATEAVHDLTPAMAGTSAAAQAARHAWAQKVVLYALGSANIPGAPAPSPSTVKPS